MSIRARLEYQFTFFDLFHFSEKSNVRQKHQNFIRRDPYKLGQMPRHQQQNSKVKPYF